MSVHVGVRFSDTQKAARPVNAFNSELGGIATRSAVQGLGQGLSAPGLPSLPQELVDEIDRHVVRQERGLPICNDILTELLGSVGISRRSDSASGRSRWHLDTERGLAGLSVGPATGTAREQLLGQFRQWLLVKRLYSDFEPLWGPYWLERAAAQGDMEVLTLLLEDGLLNPFICAHMGRYPILLAANNGHYAAARYIIDRMEAYIET